MYKKRTSKWVYSIAAFISFISGCGTNYYATRLIKHGSIKGQLDKIFNSNPEKLIERGKISSHHRVVSFDGTEIDVWVMNPENKVSEKGTILMIHGLWDTKSRFYSTATKLRKMGYNVVLHDQRAHGFSDGDYVTFGAKEKKDVKTVVDALLDKGVISEPLYAVGHSMGAATSIQYAAIDPRCKAVIALAPYSDMKSITRKMLPLLDEKKFKEVMRKVEQMGEFDPSVASPVDMVSQINAPILIVHGRLDPVVPWDHGRQIYENAGNPKEFIDMELAGHLTILLGRSEWLANQIEKTIQKSKPLG